ncbi:MAG: c-type cytochrome [Burkholderiales bacterium]
MRSLRVAVLVSAVAFLAISDPGDGHERDMAHIHTQMDAIEASVIRGAALFDTYCIRCHGREGGGDGRAAKMYAPRPTNLMKSMVPDEYWEVIIRRGGSGVGRSEFMPPWGEELTDEQIRDLITFLNTIRKKD